LPLQLSLPLQLFLPLQELVALASTLACALSVPAFSALLAQPEINKVAAAEASARPVNLVTLFMGESLFVLSKGYLTVAFTASYWL
jgi:hypothetical protein